MKYSYSQLIDVIEVRGRGMLVTIIDTAVKGMGPALFGQKKKLKNRLNKALDCLVYETDLDESDMEMLLFSLEWMITNFRASVAQDPGDSEKTLEYIEEMTELQKKINDMV